MRAAEKTQKQERRQVARRKVLEADAAHVLEFGIDLVAQIQKLRMKAFEYRHSDKRKIAETISPELQTLFFDAIDRWSWLSDIIVGWAFKGQGDALAQLEKFSFTGTETEDPNGTGTFAYLLMIALGRPGDRVYLGLSRPLAAKLLEALRALSHGEIQPLFRPTKKPTTKPISQNQQFRALAVEAVAYLQGRREKKAAAERIVAGAFGIGSEAIRKWEREIKKKVKFDFAFVIGAADDNQSRKIAQANHAAWSKRTSRDRDELTTWMIFAAAWENRKETTKSLRVADYVDIGRRYQELNRRHRERGW